MSDTAEFDFLVESLEAGGRAEAPVNAARGAGAARRTGGRGPGVPRLLGRHRRRLRCRGAGGASGDPPALRGGDRVPVGQSRQPAGRVRHPNVPGGRCQLRPRPSAKTIRRRHRAATKQARVRGEKSTLDCGGGGGTGGVLTGPGPVCTNEEKAPRVGRFRTTVSPQDIGFSQKCDVKSDVGLEVARAGRTWQNGVEPVVYDYVTHRLASPFIRPRRSRRSPSGGHRHPKSTLPMCTNDGTFLRWHQPATKTTDGDRFWKSCSSELRLATSRCESGYAA